MSVRYTGRGVEPGRAMRVNARTAVRRRARRSSRSLAVLLLLCVFAATACIGTLIAGIGSIHARSELNASRERTVQLHNRINTVQFEINRATRADVLSYTAREHLGMYYPEEAAVSAR
ncbi:MAG: hypothetical protein IKR85_00100 [Clostridia bacterium]|nr:hypothetical protein [Clostridia bacterium]